MEKVSVDSFEKIFKVSQNQQMSMKRKLKNVNINDK